MLLFLIVAVVCDLYTAKIPNVLILMGAIPGIIYRILSGGESAAMILLFSLVAMFFGLWPLYQLHGLGAGDCKLLLMSGIFLPVNSLFFFVFLSLLFGAGLGILKYLWPKCKSKGTIHFSIPILCSACMCLAAAVI